LHAPPSAAATATHLYTLSLHDALPISRGCSAGHRRETGRLPLTPAGFEQAFRGGRVHFATFAGTRAGVGWHPSCIPTLYVGVITPTSNRNRWLMARDR